MRVSPAFKAIAAPLLYNELDWRHIVEGDALGLLQEGNVIEQGAKGMDTKEIELKSIQMIEVLNHAEEGYSTIGPHLRQCPLVVPILRFNMRDSDWRHHWSDRQHLGLGHCPRLEGIQAKKLVVLAYVNYQMFSWNHSIDSHVEELVVYLDMGESHWYTKIDTFPFTPSRGLVVILHDNYFAHRLASELRLFHYMQNLAEQLVCHARIRHSPSDITLVITKPLEYYRRPRFEQVVTFEAMCKNESDSFEPERVQLPDGRQWKTASEAALISFDCISLREYLTGHDWKGVFTEEEAARWLQDDHPDDRAGG